MNKQPTPPRTQRQGILLFEGSPMPPSSTAAMSSPSPHSSKPSSTRAKNTPHDGGNLRTNFTSHQTQFPYPQPMEYAAPTYTGAPYDSVGSPAAMLGHPKPPLAPRAHDFGPPAPQFRSLYVVLGAVIGTGLGVGIFYANLSPDVHTLLALPGQLFVRALRCLIVPLVLCCMTIVVAESVALGRSSIMRWRTLLPYALSSTLATIQGTCLALAFQQYFHASMAKDGGAASAAVVKTAFNLTMQCADGAFLTAAANGSLACVRDAAAPNASAVLELARHGSAASSQAVFVAATWAIGAQASTSGVATLSLVDQIVGICNTLVPVNIFGALVDSTLLSIVMFSIPLGIATAKSVADDSPDQVNLMLNLLKQVRHIFLLLLHGLLTITPIAVLFLMAGAIAKFDTQDLQGVMSQMGYLVLAFLIGAAVHGLVILPALVYLYTKANPYKYIQELVPAYVFAFGCASSMATLPVTIECIQRAKVSRTLAHIAMPFGTPVNLNAAGFYYPLSVVFMACMAGHADELTPARYVIIFFVSLLGCMGTAPVPNAGLVYSITVWTTCFPTIALPSTFALIMTADVLLDRVSTMLNVNGNAMVTRILADQVDETFEVQAAHHA